jgi:hypothetical protein
MFELVACYFGGCDEKYDGAHWIVKVLDENRITKCNDRKRNDNCDNG